MSHDHRYNYTAPLIALLQAIQNALLIWTDDSATARSFGITGVNIGESTFTIAGSYLRLFNPGYKFLVDGSTGNDKAYKVASSIKSGNTTVVTVTGTIPDATVDGNILAPQLMLADVVVTPTPMPPSAYPAAYIFADPVENTDGEAEMRIHVQVADQLGNPTTAYLALLELGFLTREYLTGKATRGEFVSGMYLSQFIETGFGIDVNPPGQVADQGPPPIQWLNYTSSYNLIQELN